MRKREKRKGRKNDRRGEARIDTKVTGVRKQIEGSQDSRTKENKGEESRDKKTGVDTERRGRERREMRG